jgi:hypothetical protein
MELLKRQTSKSIKNHGAMTIAAKLCTISGQKSRKKPSY